MLVSTEWGWQNVLTVSMALLLGNYIPLKDIERVNRFDQSKAALAYSESYLAVQYLYEYYGREQVNIFLDSLAHNADLDQALEGSFGSDYDNLDHEFHIYLKSKFNLVAVLGDTMYFWLAMAFILILGAVLAMRRKKRYYRKWEEEEKYAGTGSR